MKRLQKIMGMRRLPDLDASEYAIMVLFTLFVLLTLLPALIL